MAERWGPFAAAAGPDLLRAIHHAGREHRFTRGEEIHVVSTLNPEGPILVVETGFVATVAIASGGHYTLLSIHGPGDLVGEHALFNNTSDTVGRNVRGITKGSAWLVRQERFRQILHDHPQGWQALARHLNGRAGAAEERMCLMASEAVKRRLAVFLLQLLGRADAPPRSDQAQLVPLPLSQTEIAEWVGVSRETVERVLREWVCDGTVQTGRRSLLIRDIPRLEKIADVWRPFPLSSRPRPACRSGLMQAPVRRPRPAGWSGPAVMHGTFTSVLSQHSLAGLSRS
jgi:CRP-like cAMP-binding protein